MNSLLLNSNKTLLRFFIVASVFLTNFSCSSNDDETPPDCEITNDCDTNGGDPDPTGHTPVSQDKVDQEFFLEGKYLSALTATNAPEGTARLEPGQSVPLFTRSFLESRTGISPDVVIYSLLGQRYDVKPAREPINIISPSGQRNFDYKYISFIVDDPNDNLEPNATITTTVSFTYVDEIDDIHEQTNRRIMTGELVVRPLNGFEDVLGTTTSGANIDSAIFKADPNNFPEDHDGNLIIRFNGSVSDILNAAFTVGEQIKINILEVTNNISENRVLLRHYGL